MRLWRIEAVEPDAGSQELRQQHFPEARYQDVPGVCKAATLAQIEEQGWSLNPGRYVGVAKGEHVSDEDFKVQLETLAEELEVLNAEASEYEQSISENLTAILERCAS